MQIDVKLLLPLIVIYILLVGVAVFDLIRRDNSQIRGGKKIVWAFIICLISIIGPVAYLVLGRVEK